MNPFHIRGRFARILMAASCTLLVGLNQAVAKHGDVPDAQRLAAAKLCATLHALPAERKQACCEVSSGSLVAVCTEELLAAMQRGATKVDAKAVDVCAEASSSALQGCDWVGPLQPALPAACASLVEGSAATGAQCQSSLECADGLYCRGLSPLAPGICAAPAQVGARCEFPADNLAAYARAGDDRRHPSCAGVCLRGQCLAVAETGGSCRSNSGCAAGSTCSDGRCVVAAAPALGESCSMSAGCGGGAVCIANLCTAPKAGGDSCTLPFECRSLECRKTPGQEEGRCSDVCAVLTKPVSSLLDLPASRHAFDKPADAGKDDRHAH